MADGAFPTLVSKDRAVNAVGNPMFIEASDGAAALHKVVDVASGASDSGIATLVVRDDSLSAITPVDGDYTTLRVDANGALWVTLTAAGNSNVIQDDATFTPATSYVGAAGFFADEAAPDSVDEGDIGIARMTLDRKQLIVIASPTVDAQRMEVSATGGARMNIAEQTLTAVKISATTAVNAATNPIYVQVVSTGISASEVHSYDTSTVAADTPDNHDYTVTGTTFLLKSVEFACSAGMKVEIQTGPVGTLVTIAVAFIAKQGGFGQIVFDPPREVPVTSTGTVRVIRTNMQGSSNDVYSTIIGNDIP